MLALTDIHQAFASPPDAGAAGNGVAPPVICEPPEHGARSEYVTPRTELDRYLADRARERRRRERRERRRSVDDGRVDPIDGGTGGSERVMRKAVNAAFTIATGFAIHHAASELLKSYLDANYASANTRALTTASYPVAMIVALWWLRKNGDDTRRK